MFKNLAKPIQEKGSRADINDLNTLPPVPFLSSMSQGTKRKWSSVTAPTLASSLCLKLGHSSCSSESKASSATACTAISSCKETDEGSSMDLDLDFSLNLGNDKTFQNPKKLVTKAKVDLSLSLSTLTSTESVITYMPEKIGSFQGHSVMTVPMSSATCTSGVVSNNNQARSFNSNSSSIKTCQFKGCGKGARGASGLCIAHGGGRRCQRQGCHKGAEGRTVYCKAHGGGRRCESLGCLKSAEGRTRFCIAHGGGKRCTHDGCTRAARGKSGLCIRHGGGKRCSWVPAAAAGPDGGGGPAAAPCTRSAEGLSGLCISHGGGRRCRYPECTKGAQGSTSFCKAHGGGKRCTHEGCNKGAEGSTPFCKGHGGGKRCSFGGGGVCPKSVHGGTLFCVAHGGGKRCVYPDCTKSARGRTDYCVRHGGGKRCKQEGCGKSAQGSTDFCKAHGGGRRCAWGHPGSGFGEEGGGDDVACNSFSRGKTGLCASHSALVQDKRVHGGGTVGPMVYDNVPEKAVHADDMSVDAMSWKGKVFCFPADDVAEPSSRASEGRVHGGGLMALLKSGQPDVMKMPHSWI